MSVKTEKADVTEIRVAGTSGESAAQSDSPLNPTKQPVKLPAKKKRMIKYIRSAAGVRSKPQKPLFPDNSLSIVERFFHRMPNSSSQVILSYCGRLQLPPGSTFLSVDRVVDVARATAAEIYRTACTLNYGSQVFEETAATADKLVVPFKFTARQNENDDTMYNEILKGELNQRYDIESPNARLWNIHIVGPKDMENGIMIDADTKVPEVTIFWSFHHCICDGLSGFAFIRLFMSKMIPEAFNVTPMDLSLIPVTNTPPPLLDNYINPHFFQVIPGTNG